MGLSVPELAEETREKLARRIPAFGSVANPADVIAQLFNEGGGVFGEVSAEVRNDSRIEPLVDLRRQRRVVRHGRDGSAREVR